MNKVRIALFTSSLFSLLFKTLCASGVGGYAASNTFSVSAGTTTQPKYQIASASIVGDAVYTGVVDDSDSTTVSFATGTDDNNATTYPFSSSVFNPNVQIPNFTASVSGAVTSIAVSYPGTYDSTGTGFAQSSPPELIVDLPSSGDDGATATATVSSGGEITSVTVSSGGSGYTDAPNVSVVGGPHFLRNTDTSSSYYGRYFLISDNNQTRLTLDLSRVAQSESSNGANTFFPAGTTVEVVPAPTLGSMFGRDTSDLPSNWTSGISTAADWIYLWDSDLIGYFPYYFLDSSYEPSYSRGWYSGRNASLGVQSSKVIYPDEAFIVTKRTSGTVTFEFGGTVQTNDQEMFLPAGGNQVLMNNPYGTDVMLGELIPSTEIAASSSTKFNPGTSASAANTDTISFLQSDGSWTTFWYDSSSASNPAVTAMHVIGTRSPREGASSASTMDEDDFFIGSGSVTGLDSCNADGSTGGITGNDANWTKVTIGGTTPAYGTSGGLQGFQVTFADLQGYQLNDDGTGEVNATTGVDVTSPARGSIIYSNLIGTHEVVLHGNGYIVVEKQRDVNLKSDEGTPVWSVGSAGAGYSGNATFYCIGGGASSNAKGTVSSNGSTISVSTAGAGYSASPQVVVTGGGWRTSTSGTSARGDYTLGSSDGVLIYRGYSSGQKAFIASSNPNK